MTNVDLDILRSLDPKCESVSAYKWHIHTKWTHEPSVKSGLFGQCSLSAAGNHYDPDFACGPNSEYVTADKCKAATSSYKCSPALYATNPLVCERGDLSGKLGDMQVGKTGKISHTWIDNHYPDVSESTPQWNMLLHAVCNSTTPRVACATGVTTHERLYATPVGLVAATLVIALVACVGLRHHPTFGRFYPTNLAVVASLGVLALLVYQDIVVNVSL
ncbi:hypothetical protein, variant 1 [Aphanomyces invadans]|nr:hypothetical protein, variant 1 [Aphanomyces invadans]ETW03404.1 hypothetical protein, variant 1 [Aphanomyces invadans]|eukprot:XP_008867633.1 hypothetical protein, variant 1 [Aphanomyces invadans]